MNPRVLAPVAGRIDRVRRPHDDCHAADGGEIELEALSSPQTRSLDDLDLGEFVVPGADTVNGFRAEHHATSEFPDLEIPGNRNEAKYIPGHVAAHAEGQSVHAPRHATAPAGVTQCELAREIPAIAAPAEGCSALLLVRLFGEPLGLLDLSVPAEGLTPAALAEEIAGQLGAELEPRLTDCDIPWTGSLATDGLHPGRQPSFSAGRERALAEGPEITVAICTRDRTDDLAQALASLQAQRYPRLRTLVVDNAPSDDRTRCLVAQLARTQPIEYVVEPRPGLSWARNRAIDASHTEIIAWADDDEVADPWWATEIARAFVEVPEAGAVTGIVAPAELQTEPQAWFEQYSGVRRGRGFTRGVFSPATAHEQSPLYPLPPYGAGANMAFRRSAIEQIGRFDCALGTGTATLAGEDTAALSALLLDGGTIVYQPSAIVHHRHRRGYDALERVMLGYGRGLSAYYASMLLRHPACLPELVRLSGRAIRAQLSRSDQRRHDLDGFPMQLLALNRKGLLQGAFLYPGAWLRARRLANDVAGS